MTPDRSKMTVWNGQYAGIIIHHSGHSGKTNPVDIEKMHMGQNKWGDVGYNYLIGPDGKIYEGRSTAFEGAHCDEGGGNKGNIGILVMGDFQPTRFSDGGTPTGPQLRALRELLKYLQEVHQIQKIGGHRDWKPSTECPGDNLYKLIPRMGFDKK